MMKKNQNHYVINPAYNKTPPPEQRLKGLHAKKRLVNSTHNNGDVRERSESFVLKARSNKQLKILGTAIKSETACTTELLENQNQLISEFMLKRNIAKSSPDPQRKETNPTIHLAQNDHGVFGEKIRRYTMDHHQKSPALGSPDESESNSNTLKKKPQPSPRPIAYVSKFVSEPVDDEPDSIYVNNCVKDANNCVEDNIYENVNRKLSYDEEADSDCNQVKSDYVVMKGSASAFHRSATIGAFIKPKPEVHVKPLSNTEINRQGTTVLPEDYVTMNSIGGNGKSLSVEAIKTDLVHTRGDLGCLYEPLDYSYIYELNPRTYRGNYHPFIKTKQKAKPMPCYCHEDPEREAKVQRKLNGQLGGSQLVYYSCEDIYVSMKNKDDIYTSLNDLSIYGNKQMDEVVDNNADYEGRVLHKFEDGDFNVPDHDKAATMDSKMSCLLKKKLTQVKQLLADW